MCHLLLLKPTNNSDVHDHLLHCNDLPAFDNFSSLAYGAVVEKKYVNWNILWTEAETDDQSNSDWSPFRYTLFDTS